jgi:thioredoxin-like negative regulator of GroEL
MFRGQEPAAAAANLLATARELARDGSWENLAVARVYYLAGQKAEGQAIVDRVGAGKTKASDLVRMARIYAEAGEWERAKPLYEQVVALEPEDDDWLAEAGARYLLAGERERGEELLAASFAEDPDSLYNALRAASGYLGVEALP